MSKTLPKTSTRFPGGAYRSHESVQLKNYKGYEVWITADYNEITGKMIKGSKTYDVCDAEDLLVSKKTIAEAHRYIDKIS